MRINNIKGSFNGTDILREIAKIKNKPENFGDIFAIHSTFNFEENLIRLVESTNGIIAKGHRFEYNENNKINLYNAPQRAYNFIQSNFYNILIQDLAKRVKKVEKEIIIAAFIDNVKIRGNIIEYLIISNEGKTRNLLINSLKTQTALPYIKIDNDLGDYNVNYGSFNTKTDIKTKIMFLNANPKAYNIDKLLEFLSEDKSVYMLYFIGITKNNQIKTMLCPVFNKQLLESTMIIKHWAGRNSRGVTQFNGKQIEKIIANQSTEIDLKKSMNFINHLINL